jgi:hypothetical protein
VNKEAVAVFPLSDLIGTKANCPLITAVVKPLSQERPAVRSNEFRFHCGLEEWVLVPFTVLERKFQDVMKAHGRLGKRVFDGGCSRARRATGDQNY